MTFVSWSVPNQRIKAILPPGILAAMPTAILLLSLCGAAGAFIDFIVGKKGDESIKERLAKFFYAVAEGNWTTLYKYPAGALLRFCE